VEADLQRFYRINLGDLFTGALTWRRLRTLIRHLPLDSATARAQHGEAVAWSDTEHLLAGIVDLLAGANWQRAQAGSKNRIPRPKPLPRPGQKPTERRYGSTNLSAENVKKLLHSFDPVQGA
jgi:hypothetical protein